MDERNCALAFYYRNPPPMSDARPLPYNDICSLVRKKNGKHPSLQAVKQAVANFREPRLKRGRKPGWRKSSPGEDKLILKTMLRLRGDGLGVTAEEVRTALSSTLRKSICPKTITRRLAEQKYKPLAKLEKSDFGVAWRQRRLAFCKVHRNRTAAQWGSFIQGVADIKEFTYYPRRLKARATRAADRWTYMRPHEKMKPGFLKPKRPFLKKEMRRTKKMKLFVMALSMGGIIACEVPLSFTTAAWKRAMRTVVGPLLRKSYPNRRRMSILLDGERPFHSAESVEEMRKWGVKALPKWPANSPDLNPAENVWPFLLKQLRRVEKKTDKFSDFKRKLLRAARRYPSAAKLVQAMAFRMNECCRRSGAILRT